MIRWAFCLLILPGTAVACEGIGQRMVSDKKDAPGVYVEVEDIPLARPFSMRINVCDDAEIENLRVDALMPAHQHGMNYNPSVTALDNNVFEVNGMLFHMPGEWELQVDLAADGKALFYKHTIAIK